MKDKIIFWINGPDLHFCMSHFFEKMYDADLYAIYDVPIRSKSFFMNQRIVNFRQTWFYYDHIKKDLDLDIDYLSKFENTYKIDLWKLAINERIFSRFNNFHNFTREEILSILSQECKLYEKILDEIKPDYFITSDPALHHSRLFYEMCRSKGIHVIMLTPSRIGKKIILLEDPQKMFQIEHIDNSQQYNSFEELQQFLKSSSYYNDVIKNASGVSTRKNLIKAAITYLISDNSISKIYYTYYGRNKLKVLINKLIIESKSKYRNKFINKKLNKKIVDKKIVYFPLHMEIEQYPLIIAPFYTNQIEMIRNIVKSLPIEYVLYVKEHPAQILRGWRSISDYKEITKIPNVVLIHPSVSPELLYKNCSLVITIAGTASLEAAFYGKPSIIFSDMFFDDLPSVYRVKSIEDLPKIIQKSLTNHVNLSDLNNFLNKIKKISCDFNYFDFLKNNSEHFYFEGNLLNVSISDHHMKIFINQNEINLRKLTAKHIERIKEYKQNIKH